MALQGLVVGLGNPGRRYARTRHNIGFAVVDRILEGHGTGETPWPLAEEKDYLLWNWKLPGGDWLLAKPMTYMNLSGRAVLKLMSKYYLHPQDILVVHDDLDLLLGKMKLKRGGGLAGHNGLKSIASSTGSQEFDRLRIGISRPHSEGSVTEYVLSPFSEDERPMAEQVVAEAAQVIDLYCASGFEIAMQRANGFVPV
jgi:peptidyl-tRNA hydrolase, PTH1 family